MLRRLMVLAAMSLVAVVTVIPAALADHGEGHNGETMELSKSEDITHGETVEVTLTSFLPDASITVVTCFVYPAAGPTDCELSNYGQFTATADATGTAVLDYTISQVPGKCDATAQCYIVAGDGFGPDANYASVLVSFAAAEAAEEPTAEPTEEPEPEPTAEPEPEPTEEPEPEPTAEPEPEPVSDDSATTESASAATDADDDDGGGSALAWLIPLIVIVAAGGLGGAYFMNKRGAAGS